MKKVYIRLFDSAYGRSVWVRRKNETYIAYDNLFKAAFGIPDQSLTLYCQGFLKRAYEGSAV